MSQAFIIIQIGNEALERVCAEAIVPAVKACGLEPRRVDKHNEGGLLKSEIIKFIHDADILIADLTNERPNVYLEIGYAMGVDKFRNLILTVREDHFPDSPSHQRTGPKVHFDLAGYDILRWSENQLVEFRAQLEKRIRRRLTILTPASERRTAVWDADWINDQRSVANVHLAEIGRSGFMELRAAPHPPKLNKNQAELNAAAKAAQIETFGWPIAVYLDKEEFKPKPRADGIVASIRPESEESYDYWAIRRNGDFFFVGSLFEDERRPGEIFFNTRIVRVAESLLYLIRLYSQLGLDRSARVSVAVRHGGLKGRKLSAVGSRTLHRPRSTEEEEVDVAVEGTLDDFENRLVDIVIELLAPLFTVFDFFEVGRDIYEDIVNSFIGGNVS
jgi:hypothetical protein